MKRIFAAFALLLFACNKNKEKLIQPTVQDITESVYASGTVKSLHQYEVFSSVNGIVGRLVAKEGDTISKGDPILKLVNEIPALSAENARIAATYSSVAFNTDKLNELKVNIGLAREKMKNDSGLLSRQQNLWAQGIGTRNELEQRELAWKSARTAYEAALLRYQDLRKEIDFAARQSAKNLQINNSISNDYTIRSQQSGRVYKILKDPGEMVTMQTPVAIVGSSSEFIMELNVDEYDIGKIKHGQKVFASMGSHSEKLLEGTITKIETIIDERTRSFQVEAAFASPPAGLYPNMTIEANILISTKKSALTIPRTFL
ncbi:MAG: HlyD family efflux transporter periplasmic adaptor subunit, partial [Chitinophagaceae bacterium]